jgi:hypothetical protein
MAIAERPITIILSISTLCIIIFLIWSIFDQSTDFSKKTWFVSPPSHNYYVTSVAFTVTVWIVLSLLFKHYITAFALMAIPLIAVIMLLLGQPALYILMMFRAQEYPIFYLFMLPFVLGAYYAIETVRRLSSRVK